VTEEGINTLNLRKSFSINNSD